MIIFPLGQLLFGWPAQSHVHWIVPQFGTIIFCFGLNIAFGATQGFLIDYCGESVFTYIVGPGHNYLTDPLVCSSFRT